MVLLREGHVNVKLLTDLLANDLILKAGDKCAGADLKIVALSLTTVESNSVNRALVVDVCDIALLARSVGDLNGSCVSLANLLDLLLNVLLGSLSNLLCNLKCIVACDLYLRLNKALSLKHDVTVGRNEIKLGVSNDVEAGLLKCLLKCVGNARVDSILKEDTLAVHLLDDSLRRLSASEAGNVDILYVLLVRLNFSFLKSFLANRKLHYVAGLLGKFLFNKAHCFSSGKYIYFLFLF